MQNRELARSVFENMPDEVFELYIGPLIKDLGWSYSSKSDPISRGWQQAFDNNQLATIVELEWKQGNTNYRSLSFHNNSVDNLNWIVQAHVDGIRTPCSDVRNGKQRFESCLTYIKQMGRLPKPVVFMNSIGGFRILDGNHRLAAALAVSRTIDAEVPYWIGSRPSVFAKGYQWP